MKTLRINGFLGLSNVNIELDGLTVLIGEQASGKSVVARLIYFFIEYFADFDEISLLKNEHKKTYDSRKKSEFNKIFPNYAWASDSFEIIFHYGEHEAKIVSVKNSEAIEISTSKSVANYFRTLKSSFKQFYEAFPESERFTQSRVLREFKRIMVDANSERYERPLFVPAARSFYATIREEIFSILSFDEKIDRIVMQFGEFYESTKLATRQNELLRSSKDMPFRPERKYFEDVVRGQYVRIDNRDWIQMPRGRVEMSKASSGQQEAVPLLFAISRFPSPGRTLIIEEPEAHLFPSAQVAVLDFIVRQCVMRDTDILFTTHSPYLLTALNNHLLRGIRGMNRGIIPSKVRAYALDDNGSRTIVDDQTQLISAEYIDSVSERIGEEFDSILSSAE